jgi:ABC-type antimicrobial peptide transport system permease subunit
LHIALRQGRIWDATENHNAAHVALINRTLAQRYYPGGNAIQHMLKLTQLDDRPPRVLTASQIADSWLTIVGIVDDVRNDGLKNPAKAAIYVPFTLSMSEFTQIFVKSSVTPMSLAQAIRKRLTMVNPEQQTYEPEDLEAWILEEPEWQQEHLTAWIFGIFAGLALVLAAVGLYSTVSYAVAQRTNEFGVRMALGAQGSDVMRNVFAANLVTVSTGVIAGLTLALALSGVIQKWTGASSGSPVALTTGTLLLSVVSAIACGIPAVRATKIDPMAALRFE